MLRTRKIRLFAAPFLLALLLAAAPAEAAGAAGPGWAARLWSWLWAAPGTDSGPAIDPDGRTFATGQVDSGPMINPDGRNGATATATPSTDEGPIIDPGGRSR